MRAARELVPRPLWVFDSPLLRRVMAGLNVAAVPAVVRGACGLSQRDLAGVAGWSADALGSYERGLRGGVFDIRMLLQFADAIGMPRAALLPLVVADPGARLAEDAGGDGTGMDIDRRGFGGLAAGAAIATLFPGPARRAVSGSHVRYWRACADALYARDRTAGGAGLLRPALWQWQQVRQSLASAPGGGTGRELLAAAGEMALCAGWVALDGGCPGRARDLYGQARELAAGAGDPFLAVHVLASLSMLEAEAARTGQGREPARRALLLAYEAAEEGRYLPVPRLHALISLRQASAASLLGDRAAFRAGIGRARRELARGPADDDPPQWLRFVTGAEVTGVEARGHLNLGDAGRGVVLYREVLQDGGLPVRNRVSYGAGLADALLRQGAGKDAVAAATGVLAMVEGGVSSARCMDRLRLVRSAVGAAPWAEEFCARFDAAGRALAAACQLPGGQAGSAGSGIPA